MSEPTTAAGRALQNRRPYTAQIGSDARVIRADGSAINFGDAIYHPDNVEEAQTYAVLAIEAEARQQDGSALRLLRECRPFIEECVQHWIRLGDDGVGGAGAFMRDNVDLLIRLDAYLALPPSAPLALDVERLARALFIVTRPLYAGENVDDWRHLTAEKIAAEYARLEQD